MTDTEALNAIHDLMSGREWDANTLDAIAELVQSTGRHLADYDPDIDPSQWTPITLPNQ